MSTTLFDLSTTTLKGETLNFSDLRGKVILIVNTASKCGFTPQYEGLETLHKIYADKGLVIIGFPCNQFGHQEPGSSEEIGEFCQVNYGVSFIITEKINVNGPDASPVFDFLKKQKPGLLGSEAIKWNFTKFLINKKGEVVNRYASATKPKALIADIEKALSE